MNMSRHDAWDELVSAALTGDLTREERRQLDLHLDGCAVCRETMASFAEQRRIVAGLRAVAPPRDLGARVRTGIERGTFGSLPWWRRPVAIFAGVGGGLALVAGVLLALVLLDTPRDPQIGQPTPTPSSVTTPAPSAAETPVPTLPPLLPPPPASVEPGQTAAPTPSSAATPTPSSTASPEPDLYLAYTGEPDNMALTVVDGSTGELVTEADAPSGEPILSELSPDGTWLAYVTRIGESGLMEFAATRVAESPSGEEPAPSPDGGGLEVGETLALGTSVEGSPFLERLTWSADGQYLAFTLAAADDAGTDAWVYEAGAEEAERLTDTGDAYAASWVAGEDDAWSLWVSQAGEEPSSHLVEIPSDDGAIVPIDPSADGAAVATAEGIFLPILSPNGRLAFYWAGIMERAGSEWLFVEGGAPYLAEHPIEGDDRYRFTNERPVFSDLTIRREAFRSAAIAWGPDGNAYAVWDADWTGTPQSDDGSPYPDRARVYFGHATDPRGLTRTHAIDADDVPDDTSVVNVKVSPTGRHLAITVQEPRGGILEAPRGFLLLVERNTGDVPDEVEIVETDRGWTGAPAFGPSDEDEVAP
jgi:hypothetical protein